MFGQVRFTLMSKCLCPYRAKYAIGAIKKKLNDKNPHVALYALEVRHIYIVHILWLRLLYNEKKLYLLNWNLEILPCCFVRIVQFHSPFLGEICFGEMCWTVLKTLLIIWPHSSGFGVSGEELWPNSPR